MSNVDINALCLLIHLHTVHVPRVLEAKKLEIELFCIHHYIILSGILSVGATHEKP
jgi:hypothetical protein